MPFGTRRKASAIRSSIAARPTPLPAARSKTRYIYQVFRNTPKELVFAQTVFGFELAAADPRVVAINFVGGEDNVIAMADYATHMRMIGFLRDLYPGVHVSLHAGELAPGLVPPEGLCCHIRLAVEQARADRIGHGVDVMYEDRPYDLLKNMADKGVLVEINLTSNKVILGIEGKHHPFMTYRKLGVPVALSTDDEGVSRIDLTHEYVEAVETYGLAYADLKEIVRNSLEYSFLPGASLWSDRAGYARFVARLPERGSGPERAFLALRLLSRLQRKGCAAMGTGTTLSGLRGQPLSEARLALRKSLLAPDQAAGFGERDGLGQQIGHGHRRQRAGRHRQDWILAPKSAREDQCRKHGIIDRQPDELNGPMQEGLGEGRAETACGEGPVAMRHPREGDGDAHRYDAGRKRIPSAEMDEEAKDGTVHQEGGRAYDPEPDRILANEAHQPAPQV